MKLRLLVGVLIAAATLGAQSNAELQEQVRATERAFAKTMADRDHAAFVSFLAPEAIFLTPTACCADRSRWATDGSGCMTPQRRRSRGSPNRWRCWNRGRSH